jgi:hypothetical protein
MVESTQTSTINTKLTQGLADLNIEDIISIQP